MNSKSGSEERMEVHFADGRREMRPLNESSWIDLLSTDSENADQEVFADFG